MKLAFAGKGGVGKTTLCAWLGDRLARRGRDVWLVDADTALSLGQASGLIQEALPMPLAAREDLVRERIGQGMLHLTPDVADLSESLAVDLSLGGDAAGPSGTPGRKRLLVMGSIASGGSGCACAANALLKALLAHLVCEPQHAVLVDLEAGVEHLGRGTVESVDGLVVVSEPSLRGLHTAAEVARLGRELGLSRQVLVLNRCPADISASDLPLAAELPDEILLMPSLAGLTARQLGQASVLGLPEQETVDALCDRLLTAFA